MKLAYTGLVTEAMRKDAEEAVESFLYEHTEMGEDEIAELAPELVVLVASLIAPNTVVKVVES